MTQASLVTCLDWIGFNKRLNTNVQPVIIKFIQYFFLVAFTDTLLTFACRLFVHSLVHSFLCSHRVQTFKPQLCSHQQSAWSMKIFHEKQNGTKKDSTLQLSPVFSVFYLPCIAVANCLLVNMCCQAVRLLRANDWKSSHWILLTLKNAENYVCIL